MPGATIPVPHAGQPAVLPNKEPLWSSFGATTGVEPNGPCLFITIGLPLTGPSGFLLLALLLVLSASNLTHRSDSFISLMTSGGAPSGYSMICSLSDSAQNQLLRHLGFQPHYQFQGLGERNLPFAPTNRKNWQHPMKSAKPASNS